ncbi:transposase [Pseudarthrobacter sp. SSS035]|uniref:transposase n=1 Tax=Pseudarthrobacter sp. SSS035 TaxID=2931399 RepID=UPI00200D7785|nr:transposase [Pseudarthrobacter sp. SSS035]
MAFTPHLVPKVTRRIRGLDDMIISLYVEGMTVRDIAHLESTLDTGLSAEAIITKVRDGHQVQNWAALIAVGVDMDMDTDGLQHVLGIWGEAAEGAKFRTGMCAEPANRGLKDILSVCCDGLTGSPEAISATWPAATARACVVYLIRVSMRFTGLQGPQEVHSSPAAGRCRPDGRCCAGRARRLRSRRSGTQVPCDLRAWRNSWARFIPFLAFRPPVRRVVYTASAIESLNYQLRKFIKNRGRFATDQAP